MAARDKVEVVDRHNAKVYGKAAVGSPPMSVPHLDTRVVDGKRSLLFGPYAGFTTKFLKHAFRPQRSRIGVWKLRASAFRSSRRIPSAAEFSNSAPKW